MRRPRSGTHLIQRGEIWYYRRGVPKDVHAAFGCTEVVKSLDTTSKIEADRLEKHCDVEFEQRLRRARDEANPETRRALIASEIIEANPRSHAMAQWGLAYLPPQDREEVRALITPHYATLEGHQNEVTRLVYDIGQLLPKTPLDPEVWQRCRDSILSIVRQQIGIATEQPVVVVIDGLHTPDWTYDRWLRAKDGDRSPSTIKLARRHWISFIDHSKVVMLGDVRRPHMVAWRDSLVVAKKADGETKKYKPKSINQRIQLVTAILRVGWRDAEMPQPDLTAVTVPEPDDNNRGAWTRDEILKALRALEPHSWQAWLYLIGLTTSVRLGEPVAAQRNWWNPIGFIELRDRALAKADKEHAMPIIECLLRPFAAYVERRPQGFLFDAPHPKDPDVPISNVASKAMNRLFRRNGIDRCFHELRDTWIEEARHSPIPKDLWEIISGHSKKTISDRYGGEKPNVLAEASEKICEFLTKDAEVMAAMLRLVC